MSKAHCYQLCEHTLVLSIYEAIITSATRKKIFAVVNKASKSGAFHDIVPAQASISFYLKDISQSSFWQDELLTLWDNTDIESFTPNTHLIETTYGNDSGPDLNDVAELLNLTSQQVIDLHASHEYQVAFLGFLPGFAYLESLPASLKVPRKSNPRAHVPAHSVAIAEELTAIYPSSSPGGWHLIGRCHSTLFNYSSQSPSLFAPGDIVRFIPTGESPC